MMPWPSNPNPFPIQTPQQLLPASASTTLDLSAIQGDAVIGLQKKWERFVFFTIGADVAAFKGFLRGPIAVHLTSAEQVREREGTLRDHKAQFNSVSAGTGEMPLLPMVGVNVAFTHAGLQKLLPQADMMEPNLQQIARSATDIGQTCGDVMNGAVPASWDPAFLQAAPTIDGVLLIAGSAREEVDAEWTKLAAKLGTAATEVWANGALGNTRPGAASGHEHFGWQDGISQPAVEGVATPFPGQDVISAGQFVFGANGAPPAAAWMANGSFMVFRKLEQAVAEFGSFVTDAATALGMDPDLLGARMVGRWKSGAPVSKAPLQDDETLASNPHLNNDFDFGDDQQQRRCPFGAHIRKTNPRGDFPGGVSSHRIMRAGIPYGTEAASDPTTPRGLLFVCYQTSIPAQFETVQAQWANSAGFMFGKTRVQTPPARTNAPPAAALVGIQPGHDPIIGQVNGGPRFMDEPVPNYPTGSERSQLNIARDFVTPRAGAYFFLPSIPAITDVLSV